MATNVITDEVRLLFYFVSILNMLIYQVGNNKPCAVFPHINNVVEYMFVIFVCRPWLAWQFKYLQLTAEQYHWRWQTRLLNQGQSAVSPEKVCLILSSQLSVETSSLNSMSSFQTSCHRALEIQLRNCYHLAGRTVCINVRLLYRDLFEFNLYNRYFVLHYLLCVMNVTGSSIVHELHMQAVVLANCFLFLFAPWICRCLKAYDHPVLIAR